MKHLKNHKTFYYRGILKSCNYSCDYCPFCKKPYSKKQIEQDKTSLIKFCDVMEKYDNLDIMFLPYGEALIHSYYLEQIGKLSRNEKIRFVGCQTNLSFEIEQLRAFQIINSKIKLWCSYHPSQTTLDGFISQCEKLLSHEIAFCVGVVGDPKELTSIRQLRKLLPNKVYLWINGMDGRKQAYTEREIRQFCEIDPCFLLEQKRIKSNYSNCKAGKKSFYINGKGDVYACNISGVKLGNIYEHEKNMQLNQGCIARHCRCFLAYSNRTDIEEMSFFNDNPAFRMPELAPIGSIKAIFFDVDGTLTDKEGVISSKTTEAVKELSHTCQIYLATSLPYQHAFKKCKSIWNLINGGSFAQGSDIRIFDISYEEIIPMNDSNPPVISSYREYKKDGKIHKIVLKDKEQQNLQLEGMNMVSEDGWIGITDKEATKLNGILRICDRQKIKREEVAVVGNSNNDLEMLKYFPFAFAVMSSENEVKSAAKWVCDVIDVPAVLTNKNMLIER